MAPFDVHLVDGTYELFRYHFAVPSHVTAEGVEVAAARGVLGSMLGLVADGATHVGVATDRVIESFRNDLFAGYKTGESTPPELFAQFPLVEAALEAAGFGGETLLLGRRAPCAGPACLQHPVTCAFFSSRSSPWYRSRRSRPRTPSSLRLPGSTPA